MKYSYSVNVYIYNKDYSSMLFIKWNGTKESVQYMVPSGEVNDDEHPGLAVKRIALEQTGLNVEVIDFRPTLTSVLDSSTVRLPNPVHIHINYRDKQRKTVNFVFIASLTEDNDTLSAPFSERAEWISLSDINNRQMPRHMKELALYLFKFKQEY